MVNESALFKYLKDMEECQIRLYKKVKQLEKRINELEQKKIKECVF